ncbi:AMP-binding protein, partial [Rhodococcus sp. 14C212]|uniref:condensation domain-containing protein n=1 Tax=Rhodococcus sp. 14C212 TaxID=2711209 RepID=UPI0013EDFB9A|nr:AMP-binding protein [Rhodococcus sp. 14C212]
MPTTVPDGAFPLSPAQYGIWLAQRLAPEMPLCISQYVEFHGDLDLELLRATSAGASREFETVFLRLIEIDGQPYQIVDPTLSFETGFTDFRDRPDPAVAAEEWMRRDAALPYDLLHDRLCTLVILQTGDVDYLVYVKAHHIVLDGYGGAILLNRGAELYNAALENRDAGPGGAANLRTLYEKDQKYRASARFAADLEYWAQRLEGMSDGAGAEPVPAAARNVLETVPLSDAATRQLEAPRPVHASSAAVILAAFACYFSRLEGKREVLVNIPVSARTTAQLRRSAGMLVNVVPLRVSVHPGDTVGELEERVQRELVGALRHQGCGIDDIHRAAGHANTMSRFTVPLVNVMLFDQKLQLGAVVGRIHVLSRGPVGDRVISVYRSGTPAQTLLEFRADPSRYSDGEVHAQCGRVAELLEEFVAAAPDVALDSVHESSAREGARRYRDAAQLDYWKSVLADRPETLELPGDRPRPAHPSARRDRIESSVDARIHRRLTALARERGTGVFTAVHAALVILLARLGGTDDIAVGTSVVRAPDPGAGGTNGDCLNTVVLRTHVNPAETFVDLLGRVRQTDRAAVANADVSFDRVARELKPDHDKSHFPLFRVALGFRNPPLPDPGTADCELQLSVAEGFGEDGEPAGLRMVWTFATELFDDGTVCGFAERFVRILDVVTAEPDIPVGDVGILGPAERKMLTPVRGAAPLPARTLPQILTTAASHPDAVAVCCGGTEMTYRELDEGSNRLARVLIERGAGPERFVAVAIARSVESVLTVWAVAKAGGAFVPVDPDHPAERIEHMLTDSQAVLGVTVAAERERLPGTVRWLVLDAAETVAGCASRSTAPVTDADRGAVLRTGNTAYVIFTSGSTGVPKGVVVTHRGLAALAEQARAGQGV